jgi:hypothetical protein
MILTSDPWSSREPPGTAIKIVMAIESHQFENRRLFTKLNKGINDPSSDNDYFIFKQIPYIHFTKYSPHEIQNGICTAMKNRVAAILYISRKDFKGEKIAAGKYFAQVATSLGIPVLMWTPDNPGLGAAVSDHFSFLTL